MATATRTSIVLFEAASTTEQAVVHVNDRDKFFVAVADAARSCQVMDRIKEFRSQFAELVNTTLQNWIEEHRDRIQSAHLTMREHDILFVVMQKTPEFDQVLSEALTELDMSVANSQDLRLIDLEVLAIPFVSNSSCTAFSASGHTITYAQ